MACANTECHLYARCQSVNCLLDDEYYDSLSSTSYDEE